MWGNFQPGKTASETELKLWEGVCLNKKYVFSGQNKKDKYATFISSDILEVVSNIKF